MHACMVTWSEITLSLHEGINIRAGNRELI